MKKDECGILTGNVISINDKRMRYLSHKWQRKGWYDGNDLTDLGLQVSCLIDECNPGDHDGKVVIVHFNDFPPATGIILANSWGDSDFYTEALIKKGQVRFLSYEDNVAYIERHPSPRKIWERLNYLYWEKHKLSDFFHRKVSWIYKQEDEIIGECKPHCQCKHLN